MTDISYNTCNSKSDQILAKELGAFIRHHRMVQNKTQSRLATEAGLSRSTLSLLERGETVTLATLLQVLRVLDQLKTLEAFAIKESIHPIALAKMEKEKRIRASGKAIPKKNKSNW